MWCLNSTWPTWVKAMLAYLKVLSQTSLGKALTGQQNSVTVVGTAARNRKGLLPNTSGAYYRCFG